MPPDRRRSTRTDAPTGVTARTRLHVAALVVACAMSGCATPRALAALQEELNQASDAVNDIRVTMSVMQTTIDSLTSVVARQDSTISRVANAAGVPIPK